MLSKYYVSYFCDDGSVSFIGGVVDRGEGVQG